MAVLNSELLFRFRNIVLKPEQVQVMNRLFSGRLMPVSPKNAIGQQLAQIRAGRSMSQSEFAAHCQRKGWDISRETLAKIESGVRCVTDVELIEIAESLKVPMQSLFPRSKKHLFNAP